MAEKEITLEDSTRLAALIEAIKWPISLMDKDLVKACIKDLKDRGGTDDALGCLIKPEGYIERSDLRAARIRYLTALLELREAAEEVSVTAKKRDEVAGQRDDIARKLGLEA